jgi:hypothetical protein
MSTNSYYDEATKTTYYDAQMVLNITEYDTSTDDRDNNVFIVFDKDTQLLYLFGARSENEKFVRYEKTFDDITDLFNFISISIGKNRISISINYLDGLTNYDNYDDFCKKVTKYNEVIAYDNARITQNRLTKYLNAFLF